MNVMTGVAATIRMIGVQLARPNKPVNSQTHSELSAKAETDITIYRAMLAKFAPLCLKL